MNSVQSKHGITIVFDRVATGQALAAIASKCLAWWPRKAMKVLAEVLPNSQQLTLPHRTHTLKASVIAPVIAQFFTTPPRTRTIALAHQPS